MERFPKIERDFTPLTIFTKQSVLDVWKGSEYASAKSLSWKKYTVVAS